MKFLPGPLGTSLSGSLGGTVASHNRYGSYFRQRATPVNPNSTRQATVRAVFASLVSNWTDVLTAANRQSWNNWAANTPVDGGKIITGQNAYIRFATVNQQTGGSPLEENESAYNNGPSPINFGLIVDGGSGKLGVSSSGAVLSLRVTNGAPTTENGRTAIWIGPPINPSRNFYAGPWQFAASQPIFSSELDNDFSTPMAELANDNGAIVAGQFRSVRARVLQNDGRLSEAFDQICEVVAESI